jgi:hypothetical protein
VFDINTVFAIDLHQEGLRKLVYAFSVERVATNFSFTNAAVYHLLK